ncbi:MAG: hypothetical protein HYZ89_07225 [Candidatus Omnitrophica bacterium]|nr:hypothetical protein [Candidatus Omnitrophota bacterium]
MAQDTPSFKNGQVTLPAGQSSVAVTFQRAFAGGVSHGVKVEVPYQTSWWITNKTTSGFTINVGTTNVYDQTLYWEADAL